MTRSKLGLLVLCGVVLGTMAISASSAQAALSWLVLNAGGTVATEVKSEKIVKKETAVNLLASITAETDSAKITLLTKILKLKIGLACTSFTTAGINLEPKGKLSEGAKIIYTGCFLEGGLPCTVKSAGSPAGTIADVEIKGELVLHTLTGGGTEVLMKLEPKSTRFTTILLEGAECPLPVENAFTGVIYLKDSEKFATTHKVKHLLEVGPLTSLLVGSDTAEHLETTIDGSAWVKLGGVHSGLAWAGMDSGSALSWLVLNAAGTIATEVKSEEIVKEETVVNLLASVTAETDSAKLTLLTKLLKLKLGLTCTGFTTAGINLEAEGKLSGEAKVIFTGCFVSEGAPTCTVKTLGSPTGTIAGKEFKGELVLHEIKAGEKEVLVKLEPKSAPFATILFEGAECPLPVENAFTGVIYLKDSEKFATTHKVKHLLEVGPLTSLYIGSDTVEHLETSIDGSIWAKLGGAHNGLAWAGMDDAPPPPPKLSWLVLNEAGTVATEVKSEGGKVNLPASVMAEADSAQLTLLTKLVGIKVGVSCTVITAAGINLEPEGKLSEGGQLIFTGCFVSEGGAKCTVKSVEAPTDTIETAELKGQLVLHEIKVGEKEVLVKIEPKTSTEFATLLFAGSECALPASSKVTGVVYFKDSEKFATTHKVKHLLEVGPLTSLSVGADSAEHLETTIDGSIWAKLGGAHFGLAWAGMDA